MAQTSDWRPVFRILCGVGGKKARDVWTDGTRDFGSDPLLYPGAQWKSPLVDEWGTLGVQKVKMSLYSYSQGLTEVRELIFNGKGSDKMNWFSQDRLISSPWTDLKTEANNFFSLVGDTRWQRSFFISRSYGGCEKDSGWLVVPDGGTACAWETRDKRVPHILFSRASTYVNWTTGDVGIADVMVVSIKTD